VAILLATASDHTCSSFRWPVQLVGLIYLMLRSTKLSDLSSCILLFAITVADALRTRRSFNTL
jgi:hypothetical protein